MFKLDNRTIPLDQPFTHNEIQYPANWLRLASPQDKLAIGITEEADPVRADDRFYWNGDLNLPRDLDELKVQFTAQVKQTAFTLLQQSDWYVTRASEFGTDVPSEIVAERLAIRTACATNEAAIAETTTVEELAQVNFQWPTKEQQ
jgi:hypothetical protein